MLDWESLFRRYIWDDKTTSYFVPLSRLNKHQADNEILIYCLFLGILFGVVALTSMSSTTPHGRSPGISLYGISVVCAAGTFVISKHYLSGLYLSATPLAGLAYLMIYGFGAGRSVADTLLVLLIVLLLLWYSLRIVGIARIYHTLPIPNTDQPRRRLFKK